ncbi:hypothetical protein PRIPAC_87382 [Pristionchus pacificus]|uniref:Uncharacterized protein n=1 Tax=Pristionchus pacificus TaxID=54126 RepID=A0A2A6B805_PRIPA|nr:hypothetical protein PRIPAC_87382 [Pristionchus pacificus]|eukprot:PDM62020.1 hypothetical protein PRIPAC_51462 [Pristionchus pacificus]
MFLTVVLCPLTEVVFDGPSLVTSTPLTDVVDPIDVVLPIDETVEGVDDEPVTELLLPPDPVAVDDADDVLEPDTVLSVVVVDPDELNVVVVLPVPAHDVIVEPVDPIEVMLDPEEVNVEEEVDVVEPVEGDPVTVTVCEPIDVVAANIYFKM